MGRTELVAANNKHAIYKVVLISLCMCSVGPSSVSPRYEARVVKWGIGLIN